MHPMEGAGPDPKLELLRGVPLFASLEPDALAAVAAITEERTWMPARR